MKRLILIGCFYLTLMSHSAAEDVANEYKVLPKSNNLQLPKNAEVQLNCIALLADLFHLETRSLPTEGVPIVVDATGRVIPNETIEFKVTAKTFEALKDIKAGDVITINARSGIILKSASDPKITPKNPNDPKPNENQHRK